MPRLIDILKDKQRQHIDEHMPAKDAPVPSVQDDLDSFIAAFESAWVTGRDTSRSIEADGFHPSSLGIKHGRCARRNGYLLRGVEKQDRFDSRTLRVFANGHAVHARLQDVLEKMGIQMESEVSIDYDDPPIKGHCDGVIEWNDRPIVIEIKSCSDEVFTNRLKWKKPKDEHFDQVNIYAYVLNIDTVYIIYENKNTQELKVFEVPADRVKAEKIIKEWQLTWRAFNDGQLPKRPYKIGSPVCAGCDLKEICVPDPEMGVDLKNYRDKDDTKTD